MEIIEYDGRLYEMTLFASVGDDPLVLECWDLAADGGLLFTMVRDDADRLLLTPRDRPVLMDIVRLAEDIADRELPRSGGAE